MDVNQIAHDLAVAKSVKDGSDTKEIIMLYHEYSEEFLNILSKEPIKLAKANAMKPPHA